MTDTPHPDDLRPVDWRTGLDTGGALTLAAEWERSPMWDFDVSGFDQAQYVPTKGK